MRIYLALIVLVLSSCVLDFPSETDSARFRCASDQDCLADFVCRNQLCISKDAPVPSNDSGTQDDEDSGMTMSMDTGVMEASDSGSTMTNPDATMMPPVDAGMSTNPDAMSMMDSDAATMANPDATAMDPDAGVADTGPMPCNSPMVMCGNDCVDLDSDSNHCGVCDRSCGFGNCSRAECQAFDYYVNTTNDDFGKLRTYTYPNGDTALVWAIDGISNGRIEMRSTKDTVSSPLLIASLRRPREFQMNENYIWFSNQEDDTTKAGGVYYREMPPTLQSRLVQIATMDTHRRVGSMGILGNSVYWYTVMSVGGLRIRWYDLDNNGFYYDYLPETQDGSYARFLVVEDPPGQDPHLFYMSGNAQIFLRNYDLSDSGLTNHSVANPPLIAREGVVTQDATQIYWTDDLICNSRGVPCSIYGLDKGNGRATVVLEFSNNDGASTIHYHDGYIYFIQVDSNDAAKRVGRIATTVPNAQPEFLANIPNFVDSKGLTVADDYIFWTQNNTRAGTGHVIRGIRLP